MSNTNEYYDLINKYRSVVTAANEEYNTAITSAEEAKGSPLYDRLINEANEKRENAINAIRKELKPKMNDVLKRMKKNITELKPIPPTSEMIETLELLKMRDNLSDAEIRAAGELCSSCPSAFAVVAEMAQKRNLPLVPKRGTIGGENGDRAVEALRKAAMTTLEMPKVNNRPEWIEMNSSIYGKEDTTNGRSMDFFQYDRSFNTDRDMISSWSGINDGFDAFYETLNKGVET